MNIAGRDIGRDHEPYVIAEIGINHAGDVQLAKRMIRAARDAGASAVKFQTHTDDEFCDTPAYPANAGGESIQSLIKRCSLSASDEAWLKTYADEIGITFLSTPFTISAVDRLERLNVPAYKIGSGHLTDLTFIGYIASKGKPIILSTGMGDVADVSRAVSVIEHAGVPYALLACTSLYPTPYSAVRLGTVTQLRELFPRAGAIGLSCHSKGPWTAYGAVALGASIIEKHFYVPGRCPAGPDIEVSITPSELADLAVGSRAIWEARGGTKTVVEGEELTLEWFRASRRR